jgi:molybdenum cofactor synthesis domain-containing protein
VVTAGIVVIGNEVLSGKVEEANARYMIRELRALGVELKRVVVIRDELPEIAREVGAMAASFDHVITSGGVGSTHDDVTIPAVAKAFGVAIRRDEDLAKRIRDHFGARTTEGHLRMADLPTGGLLLANDKVHWPVLAMENVYVLPGVPEIFARKLEVVRERLGESAPYLSAAIYTRCDEGTIAELLARIETDHRVLVGSYPRFDESDHSLKLTFDGTDAEAIDAALDACLAALDPGLVVRIERAR